MVASPLNYTYVLLEAISAQSMTTTIVPVPLVLQLEVLVKVVSVIGSQFASCSSTETLVTFLECTMYRNVKVNESDKDVPGVMFQKDIILFLIFFESGSGLWQRNLFGE